MARNSCHLCKQRISKSYLLFILAVTFVSEYPYNNCIIIVSAVVILRIMSTFSLLENYKVNSTFKNLTRNETGEARDYGTLLKSTFGIIATLSFFGNMLLCLVIFMKRSMLAKQYNILICSLAVTDMLTGRSQYMKHFHSFLFL